MDGSSFLPQEKSGGTMETGETLTRLNQPSEHPGRKRSNRAIAASLEKLLFDMATPPGRKGRVLDLANFGGDPFGDFKD